MPPSSPRSLPRIFLQALVLLSGAATLSWEVIWQLKSSLALGVSARGTALTLAITMGGMGLGSFLMGWLLRRGKPAHPIRIYGALECIIGISGLCLGAAFAAVEQLDTHVYAVSPESAPLVHILAIVATLGVPAICMGATLPVFGFVAREFRISLALLYGLNTLGAAAGTLVCAFALIPLWGITHTGWAIAFLNFAVGAATYFLTSDARAAAQEKKHSDPKFGFMYALALACRFSEWLLPKESTQYTLSPLAQQVIVAVTGFATLSLEVAWFRSITAAFQNTTCAFAIMLSSVLIALGVSASHVEAIKKKKIPLGSLICWAGILILLVTPLVERFDLFLNWDNHQSQTVNVNAPGVSTTTLHDTGMMYAILALSSVLNLFLMSFLAIAGPMLLLGTGFPWVLDEQDTPRRWGRLYALNTFAAIIGSLSAAWIFLPAIGFAKTAWISGILVAVTGLCITPGRKRRMVWGGAALIALVMASAFDSGVGRTRALGMVFFSEHNKPNKLIGFFEGPDSTISVSEDEHGWRTLIIDGSSASAQAGGGQQLGGTHYLNWMGSLPMLLNPNPKNALVICFGTGQTANAVRKEQPDSLDIVDINQHVFDLAHNFSMNENVLTDPHVHPITMDGRAYMRRTQKNYDVITLEPMPPNLAGVNALYSKEFYELARQRMNAGGVIAQWLPFNTITPYFSASVARTFQDVFPNAVMWFDPVSPVGILIGTKDDTLPDFGTSWPGFARVPMVRNMPEAEVMKNMDLYRPQLERYSAYGDVITDDNQLLAYGKNILADYVDKNLLQENLDFFGSGLRLRNDACSYRLREQRHECRGIKRGRKMKKITAAEFDKIFEEGKEDILQYFDPTSVCRINQKPKRVEVTKSSK